MAVFSIELAGVPAEITCRFPGNERFFRDYFTDRTPVISVEASDADLERMRAEFDRAYAARGLPKRRQDAAFLENNALHALLAEKLTAFGVLLMHGSALCMDGQAIVFVAPSGTGKSTHARLWREAFGNRVWMINDDKPMLRLDGGRAAVFGTPWNGKDHLSRNASAPLKAIVRLTRDETNHIEPLKRAGAFSALVTHSYRAGDPIIMRRILALETGLLDAADFYQLGCNMAPEAAETAWQVIRQHYFKERNDEAERQLSDTGY